jgi:hypothetical protein
MSRPGFHRVTTLTLILAVCLLALAQGPSASAAPAYQGTPPVGIDASRPTVSGQLVAKPITGEQPAGRVICGNLDRTPDVAALMTNRGLVICTEDGKLVLLQLSAKTGLYNRNWQRLTIAGMSIGDHLNAWGVLRNGGFVLNPTFAVQDTSKPGTQLQMVSGRLVAKPIGGAGPQGRVICGDQDRTPEVAAMVNRGLVICTEEGKLILLQLSSRTRLSARDRTGVIVTDLTIGDHLNAWGRLIENGLVLNPTTLVIDTDVQAKSTASQDFIAGAGRILTLYVLQSDSGGPVQGMTHAEQRDPAHVTLCGGVHGTWGQLQQGMTIDVSGSIFNLRIMTYVDTESVRVVSCS